MTGVVTPTQSRFTVLDLTLTALLSLGVAMTVVERSAGLLSIAERLGQFALAGDTQELLFDQAKKAVTRFTLGPNWSYFRLYPFSAQESRLIV